MSFFVVSFWFLVVVCGAFYLYTRSAVQVFIKDHSFYTFQRTYIIVYLLAMAGDWLQGPHVYALYESYGMTIHQIELLFVAGFGSSMLFGTFIGSFADKFGRRFNCIVYGILYCLSCVTKHFPNFYILFCGRILGGIATSILYSAFESWLIHEFNAKNFDQNLLGSIFSSAVLGNSLIAIAMGLVAQFVADMFGFVAPFDVSMSVLAIMILVIVFAWTENYGDQNTDFSQSLNNAFISIRTDFKVLCLGLIQSLFEGSMYVFVIEWTPALSGAIGSTVSTSANIPKATIPHGIIFASFMLCIMIGSSLFKLLSKYSPVESFMRIVLLISALTFLMPVMFPMHQCIIFVAFLLFEVCVGIFWPSLSTMRGKYVPENTRATIMNFFRVPLNIIVISILILNLNSKTIFTFCLFFLLLATFCQQWLYNLYLLLPRSATTKSTMEPPLLLSKDDPLLPLTMKEEPLSVQKIEALESQTSLV